MDEAVQAEGESAALALGRHVPLDTLQAAIAPLPTANHAAFLRGLSGRALGRIALPAPWGLQWNQDPPSTALATLFAENPIVLDAPLIARAEGLLLDGDIDHQVAGARALQNTSIPLPSVTSLSSLHPVAFPIAMRALSHRGGVPVPLWSSLVATLGARVHPNPRSWSNAWLSLMDALPPDDPTLRAQLLSLEPTLTQVEIQPPSALAAYRCAIALRFDRLDQGHRAESCATGTEQWRSLVAIAERARQPMAPTLVAESLRNVITQGQSDARVLEAVAEAAVALPTTYARPILLQLSDSRDPGVLAVLLQRLATNPAHARALPRATLDRLLQAPFDLPEAPSLEARLATYDLRRELRLPVPAASSTVRAMQQAMAPDASIEPQTAAIAPPGSAGTWVIETTTGVIRVELRSDTAPEAVALLLEATRAGTYRQLGFHRVVPGFVAQGGDPRGDGYGGTTRIVPTELSGGRFERGAVGIALAGLDTGGMQFFITLTDSPRLDARYPYVGRVVSGMDVADRLLVGDQIVNVSLATP